METIQSSDTLQITPLFHATMVLNFDGKVIYVDPYGGPEIFAGQPSPDIILISDIHMDHFHPETLIPASHSDAVLIVPQVVKDSFSADIPGKVVVLNNGEKTTQNGIEIEAIPMYNIPESADAMHTKGRGNGYVVSAAGQRVYIAGDTSAVSEMRALKDIDVAFIPMNLPYTMSVEEAADAVLEFKPKVVHPYHYRGQDGLADTKKFKELVESKDPNIQVELLNFYPDSK